MHSRFRGFDVSDTSRQELLNALLGHIMAAIEDLDADECLPSQAQIAKLGQLFSTVSQLGYRVFYSSLAR